MNQAHLQTLSDAELMKGLVPLLTHQHWAYFEEYLRREQHKQVNLLSTKETMLDLGRAQGKFAAYRQMQSLRIDYQNSRK